MARKLNINYDALCKINHGVMSMFGLGVPEIGIILVIAVMFLGPSKLPQLGKSLGGAISNFKASVAGKGESEQDGNKEIK